MPRDLQDALTALGVEIDRNEKIMADVTRTVAAWTATNPDDMARWEELLEWGTEVRMRLQTLYARRAILSKVL